LYKNFNLIKNVALLIIYVSKGFVENLEDKNNFPTKCPEVDTVVNNIKILLQLFRKKICLLYTQQLIFVKTGFIKVRQNDLNRF